MLKDVSGYEGLYKVSDDGLVHSLYSNKLLKQNTDKDGYKTVNLYKNHVRKTVKVHRLVAQAFIDNPNNLPVVNHIDEVKYNNASSNLEWCSIKYNDNYGTTIQCRVEKQSKPLIGYNGKHIYTFPSVATASLITGATIGDVSLISRTHGNNYKHIRSSKGWVFGLIGENILVKKEKILRSTSSNFLVEKGRLLKRFPSCSAASRYLGVDSSYLNKLAHSTGVYKEHKVRFEQPLTIL